MKTFAEFWPFYLNEHRHPLNRRLHFAGTMTGLIVLSLSAAQGWWWGLLVALGCGYLFAWVGHFVVEKNRPATFTHPFFSLLGDFRMFWELLTGRLPFDGRTPRA